MPPKSKPDYDAVNFFLLLDVVQQLAYIRHDLRRLEKNMAANSNQILEQLDALKASMAENTSVGQSVVELLNFLTAKIDELIASGGNPAAILAKIAETNAAVKSDTEALRQALIDNTPVEDEPPTP